MKPSELTEGQEITVKNEKAGINLVFTKEYGVLTIVVVNAHDDSPAKQSPLLFLRTPPTLFGSKSLTKALQ